MDFRAHGKLNAAGEGEGWPVYVHIDYFCQPVSFAWAKS